MLPANFKYTFPQMWKKSNMLIQTSIINRYLDDKTKTYKSHSLPVKLQISLYREKLQANRIILFLIYLQCLVSTVGRASWILEIKSAQEVE